jgi:hypothetical protein
MARLIEKIKSNRWIIMDSISLLVTFALIVLAVCDGMRLGHPH